MVFLTNLTLLHFYRTPYHSIIYNLCPMMMYLINYNLDHLY